MRGLSAKPFTLPDLVEMDFTVLDIEQRLTLMRDEIGDRSLDGEIAEACSCQPETIRTWVDFIGYLWCPADDWMIALGTLEGDPISLIRIIGSRGEHPSVSPQIANELGL
jgi:hypothetical protein